MAKASSVLERTTHINKKEIGNVLGETVIDLGAQKFTAHYIATIVEYPNLRAARLLNKLCKKLGITSLAQLNRIGLHGLLNTEGCGERQAWVASMLLFAAGYDVPAWCDKGWITATNAKTRKRGKQPTE